MNCKNIKIKLNKMVVCKITNKPINFKKCTMKCKNYMPKNQKCTIISKNCAIKTKSPKNVGIKNKTDNLSYIRDSPLKNKSKKLAKLERNRFSIFGDGKNKCRICGATTSLTWHEIFDEKNRQNSIKLGLCLRLCLSCHIKYQEDKEFNEYWHKKGQLKFMEYYHKSKEDFLDIFKRNYL